MQDVEDEPLFAERVAGLDIAKAEVEVTIRVPSDTTAGRRQQETRTFGTTRRELELLGDWLRSWGATKIGMEATGDDSRVTFSIPSPARHSPSSMIAFVVAGTSHTLVRRRPGRESCGTRVHTIP